MKQLVSNILRSKCAVLLLKVFIAFIVLILLSNINWLDFDWYLRNEYSIGYAMLSTNISDIVLFCLTASLLLYACFGVQYNWTMILLILHVAVLIIVKEIIPQWYAFMLGIYVLLTIVEVIRRRVKEKMQKYFFFIKILIILSSISHYFLWMLKNNEPLVHFVRTPDFVPSPLCDNTKHDAEYFKNFMKKWIQIHNSMLDGSTKLEDKRALVFRTSTGGVGNRLVGLISSFLLAILTNRAFFVDWYPNQNELNSNLNSIFTNTKFNWNIDAFFDAEYKHFGSNKFKDDYYASTERWIPYCRLCPFRSYSNHYSIYNQLLCQDGAGFNPNQTFILLTSTQWFAPVLAHNPFLRNKICQITGPDIFGTLARFLFQPINEIEEKISEIKQKFKKSDRVIGLQIRKLEGNQINDEQFDVFLRCAKTLAIGAKQPKYFISTDNEKTRNQVIKLLGSESVILNNKSIERSSSNGIKDAIVDMWLLGETDELIVSPYSSFGDVAYSRVSKIPHRVTRNNLCFKMLSSQPCFQYWFGVTMTPCFNKSMLSLDMMNQEDCWL